MSRVYRHHDIYRITMTSTRG